MYDPIAHVVTRETHPNVCGTHANVYGTDLDVFSTYTYMCSTHAAVFSTHAEHPLMCAQCRGTSLIRTPPPKDPTEGLYLWSYGAPRGRCSFSRARYPCTGRDDREQPDHLRHGLHRPRGGQGCAEDRDRSRPDRCLFIRKHVCFLQVAFVYPKPCLFLRNLVCVSEISSVYERSHLKRRLFIRFGVRQCVFSALRSVSSLHTPS